MIDGGYNTRDRLGDDLCLPGNDGENYMQEFENEITPAPPDIPKVVAWVVLLIVLMTFGALFAAYIVISTNNVLEWRPFKLPAPLWISTFLIIASSFTYYIADRELRRSNQARARKYFLFTSVLGGMFIASQLVSWLMLYMAGLYMSGNPYAGFFYILTAIHAVHVFGGIAALGSVLLHSWNKTAIGEEAEYRKKLSRAVGWYWHFVGILWIILFGLLGFWK